MVGCRRGHSLSVLKRGEAKRDWISRRARKPKQRVAWPLSAHSVASALTGRTHLSLLSASPRHVIRSSRTFTYLPRDVASLAIALEEPFGLRDLFADGFLLSAELLGSPHPRSRCSRSTGLLHRTYFVGLGLIQALVIVRFFLSPALGPWPPSLLDMMILHNSAHS